MKINGKMNLLLKVSIIIPVYNGANYMREAINSALSQTYKNLEIIVVNDGSNDNGETERIALSYGNKIRYFSKPNGGVASALNLGIKEMSGEYFSWLSHDDIYLPEKIEHQISILSSLSNHSAIIYGGYEVIDHKSKSLYFVRPNEKFSEEKLNISLFPLLRGLIHGCALLIPSKYFREIGLFDETLLSTQDYALWFEFLRIAPIHFDDRILIRSRAHPDQGTHKITIHMQESNELWCGFLKKLTIEEMTIMEGSPYLFLLHTAAFLEINSPYHKARELAESMAKDFLSKIKISVIMPVYNRVNLAIEAIESVLTQTHTNFELIVIDDGSTDDVSQLINKCHEDPRIKYIRKENSGSGSARNLGVKHASGKYIAFLDSDDLFYRNKIETQLKFMEINSLLFSHTSYQRIDWDGNLLEYISSGTFSGYVFPTIITGCPIATPTVMGKTSIFISNKFPENIEVGEDVCLWISISSKHEIGAINLALSKVRINYITTTCFDNKKMLTGLINIASFVLHHKDFSNFTKQVKYLLIHASEIHETLEQTTNNVDNLSNKPRASLIAKIIKSLYRDGLKVTWCKILNRFRILLY